MPGSVSSSDPALRHPPVRISDAERDHVLAELRNGYALGRLSGDTFLARMDAVMAARYQAELDVHLADLPRRRGLPDVLRDLAAGLTGRRRRASARSGTRQVPVVQPAPAARAAWLVLPAGSQRKFVIGRHPSCDLAVEDLSVSRRHAGLERADDGWRLSDLGSTNGTRVNGWRITGSVPVRPGDQVTFGSVTFVVADRPGGYAT